ncbi:MAG: 3'(2'),5'-bisphosphate nucleotidase CysQ [Rhodospirillales bacterium]|nr:3'(2'),5'-bisphosphate nucleotidase CysQ [Rhodospirillales bacterium]
MTVNLTHGLIDTLRAIARRAGAEILKVYRTDFAVDKKADASPVTAADRAAEVLIAAAIKGEITDAFPIVAEEAFAQGNAPAITGHPFWLVDPLDGTKEFVERNGEFTVNIALIEAGRPVVGIVYAPVPDLAYWGWPGGAFRAKSDAKPELIACRPAPAQSLVATVSRHHSTPEVDAWLDRLGAHTRVVAGSSLKFCRIAEGAADVYPRFAPTMEWDAAAGHAVLRYAGGNVVDRDGAELTYGKPGFLNPHFVAHGPGFTMPRE